jgi:protein gp37
MADTTKIEWTDATWNPITGCSIVDAGCTNCYAMALAGSRLRNHPSRAGLTRVTGGRAKWTGEVRLNEQWLDQPLRWTRPRMIFVCAHGDLFHPAVPDEWIDRVFAVMALASQHTFQVLTKRPQRAAAYMEHLQAPIYWRDLAIASRKGGVALLGDMSFLRNHPTGPLRNVWLGTSVSDQASADLRIPHLLAAPAAVRFLSVEPMLGPVDLRRWIGTMPYIPGASTYVDQDGHVRQDLGGGLLDGLDWIICGGESGPGARPMHPEWARSLRDQCVAAGVPFFFKQWGEWAPTDVMGIDDLPQLRVLRSIGRGEDRLAHTFDDHTQMGRIGKRAAGRLLDGREWNEMPVPQT